MNALSPIIADEGAISFVTDDVTPLAVLEDASKAEGLFAKVRAAIDAHVPDLTTAKGREAIKSLAFKVTKTKTAVEDARKDKTEEWRKQTDAVNAAGRVIKARLEDMAVEARKPLTDWEQAEKDRVEAVAERFALIEGHAKLSVEDSALTVEGRIAHLQEMEFDAATFGDSLERAQEARSQAVATLQTAHARIVQEEADRAELARLRKEAADREAADAAAAAAREAERLQQQEARDAQAAADLAAERAAEAASVAAAAAADAARQEATQAHEAELQRSEEARLAAVAETQRLADAQTERDRQARADAAAATARAADIAHRSEIFGAAKAAFMDLGIPEAKAKAAVLAIAAGSVPHVSITY